MSALDHWPKSLAILEEIEDALETARKSRLNIETETEFENWRAEFFSKLFRVMRNSLLGEENH